MPSQVESFSRSTPAPSDSGQSDDTKCSLCKRTFESKWLRDWHIKRMHDESDISCSTCDATFVTVDSYNEHCIIQHPAKIPRIESPKQTLKYERSPSLKIDRLTLSQENDLLRIKIKFLKKKLEKAEKPHRNESKSLETKQDQRFKEQFKEKDDSLKEKDCALAAMQQQLMMLESTNTKLMQELQNERLRAGMFYETLKAACGCDRNGSTNADL
ncbi:uncharacterized protein LOC129575275 [Sitodiplosis mosellana]|uniref:uncharacterized protein LOC129575275 n=1 Tax=Sitodiplosis mosellana TaxID=263140 RepID=UPI00244423F6|nr:uncharacterized protein LOC129575275 [Sitodiplosis mosellana]XP_055314508.1 uncharacterized protein LOC129575275 [Sitodiplosis mosellana]